MATVSASHKRYTLAGYHTGGELGKLTEAAHGERPAAGLPD